MTVIDMSVDTPSEIALITPSVTAIKTATMFSLPPRVPVAKLTELEALETVDILDTTEECSLPCWNGAVPGETGIADIQGFFARLGINIDESSVAPGLDRVIKGKFNAYPLIRDGGFVPEVWMYWDDEVITMVSLIGLDYPGQHDLSLVINKLGAPHQIQVLERPTSLMLALVYEELQTIFIYWTNVDSKTDGEDTVYEACITKTMIADEFIVFAPDYLVETLEIRGDWWGTIENESGLSIDDFLLLVDEEGCIQL